MPGAELFRQFLERSDAKGARSTALHPLAWVLAIILSTVIGASIAKTPMWLVVCLACAAGMILVVYLVAYVYFMLTSPDALRSERFTLSKMAIERSITGDSLKGFIDPETLPKSLALPEPKPSSATSLEED